jgi:hypothetical protein
MRQRCLRQDHTRGKFGGAQPAADRLGLLAEIWEMTLDGLYWPDWSHRKHWLLPPSRGRDSGSRRRTGPFLCLS